LTGKFGKIWRIGGLAEEALLLTGRDISLNKI